MISVARGDSDDLILQAFVQEYGPKVLSEPPTKGFDGLPGSSRSWLPSGFVSRVAACAALEHSGQLATAGGPDISPELLARAQHEADDDPDD